MSDRWQKVFEAVLKKTKEKKADWSETFGNDEFVANLANRQVFIGELEDGGYYLSIKNPYGVTIDTFTDDDLKEASDYTYTSVDMRELFRLAHRSANDADAELDEFLSELGD